MNVPALGFTYKYNGIVNCLITPAKVSSAIIPPTKPDLNTFKEFRAIWDTGATGSVISKKVALDCGLKETGMTKVLLLAGKP